MSGAGSMNVVVQILATIGAFTFVTFVLVLLWLLRAERQTKKRESQQRDLARKYEAIWNVVDRQLRAPHSCGPLHLEVHAAELGQVRFCVRCGVWTEDDFPSAEALDHGAALTPSLCDPCLAELSTPNRS